MAKFSICCQSFTTFNILKFKIGHHFRFGIVVEVFSKRCKIKQGPNRESWNCKIWVCTYCMHPLLHEGLLVLTRLFWSHCILNLSQLWHSSFLKIKIWSHSNIALAFIITHSEDRLVRKLQARQLVVYGKCNLSHDVIHHTDGIKATRYSIQYCIDKADVQQRAVVCKCKAIY